MCVCVIFHLDFIRRTHAVTHFITHSAHFPKGKYPGRGLIVSEHVQRSNFHVPLSAEFTVRGSNSKRVLLKTKRLWGLLYHFLLLLLLLVNNERRIDKQMLHSRFSVLGQEGMEITFEMYSYYLFTFEDQLLNLWTDTQI